MHFISTWRRWMNHTGCNALWELYQIGFWCDVSRELTHTPWIRSRTLIKVGSVLLFIARIKNEFSKFRQTSSTLAEINGKVYVRFTVAAMQLHKFNLSLCECCCLELESKHESSAACELLSLFYHNNDEMLHATHPSQFKWIQMNDINSSVWHLSHHIVSGTCWAYAKMIFMRDFVEVRVAVWLGRTSNHNNLSRLISCDYCSA